MLGEVKRLVRVARIAWLRRSSRPKPYRKAPRIAHPERLHVSTRRAETPAPINWDALQYYDRLRQAAGFQ